MAGAAYARAVIGVAALQDVDHVRDLRVLLRRLVVIVIEPGLPVLLRHGDTGHLELQRIVRLVGQAHFSGRVLHVFE